MNFRFSALLSFLTISVLFGCGQPSSPEDGGGSGGGGATRPGLWFLTVDLDGHALGVSAESLSASPSLAVPNALTQIDGHPLEVKNGPGGCVWNAGTYTMTCEILFRNLDTNECMTNVRTRFHSSGISGDVIPILSYI